MKKSTKLMYQGAPKSLRRELHEMDKRTQVPKFKMDHTVGKPQFVVLANGERVAYEGP